MCGVERMDAIEPVSYKDPASAGGRIRVAVVDDHALVRSGICNAVGRAEDMIVAGEAGDGRAALALLERERVDVMLLDLHMPGLDGLGCLDMASIRWPELPVIVLTVDEDPVVVADVMRRGAAAYVPKFVRPDDLVALIRQVVGGSVVIAGGLRSGMNEGQQSSDDGAAEAEGPQAGSRQPAGLTPREVEVLGLVAQGRTNADIAQALFVTPKTVKFHLTNIFMKLGVSNRTEAAALALQAGLPAVPAPASGFGRGSAPASPRS